MGKQLTTSGAIQTGITKNHLIARIGDSITRHKTDPTTAHSFAHIVVGFTLQAHGHALNKEGRKTLACSSAEVEIQLALKASIPMALGDIS